MPSPQRPSGGAAKTRLLARILFSGFRSTVTGAHSLMLPMARLRILLWLGVCALAALALVLPTCPRDEVRVLDLPAQQQRVPGAQVAADAVLPRPAHSERAAMASHGTELRIALRSASTPLSPLSLVLESAGNSRSLSTSRSAVLRDLPAGRYRLRCDERCWASAPLEFDLGAHSGARELEFPIEALGPWSGRVLDARDGSTLDRVHLRWLVRGELGDMDYRAELGRGEIALDAGRFQVACGGFPARESQLCVEAPGFAPFATPWIEFDGRIAVDLGDIALLPADSNAARLGGRVVADESGAGLEGVRVNAVDVATQAQQIWVHHGEILGVRMLGGSSSRSDRLGGFSLEIPQRQALRLAAYLPARGLVLSEALEPGAFVELRMPIRARIQGRVVTTPELRAAGWIQGVNVDAAGRQTSLVLDENLRFELGGLPAGPVRVALEALEMQTAGQSVLAEVAVRTLQLREGETSELELRYGVDAQPWSIDGRLLLPDDVDWAMLRAALWIDGDAGPSRFAVIDREGHFRLEGEPPGPARVFVGGSSADSSRCCLAMQGMDLTAPALPDVDLRTASVRGSVWVSGVPAGGVPLVIEAQGAEAAWTRAVAESLAPITDVGGEFQIHGLTPGSYAIGRVGGPRVHFQVQSGAARTLELRLE